MKGKIIFSVFILISLLASNKGFSQLTPAGEGFLKGSHLELGVSACGSYGTKDSALVPPGYHMHVGSISGCTPFPGLGFVADPFLTNWNIPPFPSVPPAPPNYYCGDYFLPGTPEEGFCIKINGSIYCNCNGNPSTGFGAAICGANDIPGAITQVTDTGNILSICWNGTIAGLDVKQVTYFKKDSLYFTTLVTLTNTTAVAMDSIFYDRSLDPDNDESWSGSFYTVNTIVSQPNLTNDVALVTANGTNQTDMFLGLGSKDNRARVSHGNFSVRNPLDVWNGLPVSGTFPPGYMSSGTTGPAGEDGAISIAFKVGSLMPGQSANLSYVHILDVNQVNYAINSTTNFVSAGTGTGATNINPNGSAYICAGDIVPLTILNGNDYHWTWSPSTDLNTDTGISVICIPLADRTYHLTGSSALCDTREFDVTINLTWGAAYALGNDTILCNNNTFWLKSTAVPPSSVVWSTGSTADSIQISLTGNYSIAITNAICNAISYDTMHAEFLQRAQVALINDTSICAHDLLLDAGWPAYTHLWSTGDTTQQLLTTAEGEYKVIVSLQGRCPETDSVSISYFPEDHVLASDDALVELDESATLTATGSYHYTWTPSIFLSSDSGNSVISTPLLTTMYHVHGENVNGCSSDDSVLVTVWHEETFYMPNAFSPNGDDYNSVFGPIGRYFSSGEMTIYDRWGTQVFHTTNLANNWNGQMNGVPCPMGVYIYEINGTWRSGAAFSQIGQVSLIR